MLDNECIQSIYPLTNYEFQNQDDKVFGSKKSQSLGISSQILAGSLQGDKDENNISVSQLKLSVPIKIHNQITQENSIPLCFESF